MNHKVRLLVGLGNPGPQYAGTRHNAGQDLVEELASRQGVTLTAESKFHGLTGRVLLGRCDLRLLIPTTFMNRSGQAVASVVNFYKLQPEEVLVVHDELDLPPGVVRLKVGGGHGGNNGVRDVIAKLGSADFVRLRFGIGRPDSCTLDEIGAMIHVSRERVRQIQAAALRQDQGPAGPASLGTRGLPPLRTRGFSPWG